MIEINRKLISELLDQTVVNDGYHFGRRNDFRRSGEMLQVACDKERVVHT